MNLRSAQAALVASLSVALAGLTCFGCSSDNSTPAASYGCSMKGPCPSDPVPSATDAMSCETLSRDATCGAAFTAYSSCAYAAKQCTDAGVSDPTLDSTSSSCNSDYATYTTCLQNKMNDPNEAGAAGAGDAG